jgi:hypothetical protein
MAFLLCFVDVGDVNDGVGRDWTVGGEAVVAVGGVKPPRVAGGDDDLGSAAVRLSAMLPCSGWTSRS